VPPAETVQGTTFPGKAARLLQRVVLERRYGMPRGALRYVDLREIGFDAPDRVHDHLPSPLGVLGRILPKREVGPDDVFIDIGCGMGPVLVEAAARYDFRRVIGVDVVPEFTGVAAATIARARDRLRCRDVQVDTADVTEYELPLDVSVVYMADPFRGHLFDTVVAKLLANVDRTARPIRLIYHLPVEGGRLERTGRARLVRYGRRRNRPWETGVELVMYELEPADAGTHAPDRPPVPRLGPAARLAAARQRGRARHNGPVASPETHNPMIQIASQGSSPRSEVVVNGSSADLAALRDAFEHRHCARLPAFTGGALLSRLQGYVDEGEFRAPEFDGISRDLQMVQGKAAQLLLLLVNDPHLFEVVRSITGCKRIGRFDGGLYQKPPGREHEDAWHGEIFGHGMVAFAIDLSERPYEGGMLEIRDRFSREVVDRVETEPGDAVLLRLAPRLQHRVSAVEGDFPRTVYAGRFMRLVRGGESALAAPRRA
jgi:SAM-dependent methyltransferase